MEIKVIKDFEDFKTALLNKEVTGYIWMVEDHTPQIYKVGKEEGASKIDFSNLYKSDKPHNRIQEAYIFCDKTSYHIKNIDGKERVFIHKIEDFKENKFKTEDKEDKFKTEDIVYPSHIKGIPNLWFKKIYELKPGISDPNFKTYQLVANLFQGFYKTTNKTTSE